MAAPVGTSEQLIANQRRASPAGEKPLAPLARALVSSSVVTLLLVALWFLARRAAGQLPQPLGLPMLVSVALTLVVLASVARLAWLRLGIRPTPWKSSASLLWLSLFCGVWLLAGALTIAGTGTIPLLLFWSIVLVHEGVWCWLLWHPDAWPIFRRAFGVRVPGAPTAEPILVSPSLPGEREGVTEIESMMDSDDLLPLDVCQQLTRLRAEEEGDSVAGLLRAKFSPQQRSHSLHVAFCPPMVRRPKVTVVQLKGPRTRIKAAEVQPFGIRFDLRLVTASPTQQDVVIHFEASCAETAPAGSHDASN